MDTDRIPPTTPRVLRSACEHLVETPSTRIFSRPSPLYLRLKTQPKLTLSSVRDAQLRPHSSRFSSFRDWCLVPLAESNNPLQHIAIPRNRVPLCVVSTSWSLASRIANGFYVQLAASDLLSERGWPTLPQNTKRIRHMSPTRSSSTWRTFSLYVSVIGDAGKCN
jgi:hypothetical protein